MKPAPLFFAILLTAATAHAQDYLNCQFVPGWNSRA